MAETKFRADINLYGNEVKNFAIHNVDPQTVQNPVDGQEVYFEGKIYIYNLEAESWVEQGDAADISAEVSRATAAEEALQDNIDAEATARENADTALGGRIDDEESARIAADNTKVDKEIVGTHGTAKIFNEVDGGGVQYDTASASGDTVFVGVHGDDQVGEFVSIYAKDKSDSSATKRVIVKTGGAYYLKGNGITTTADDEIATIGDVEAEETRALAAEADLQAQINDKDSLPPRTGQSGKFLTNDGTDALWAALPEYTITKDAQAETGYAHTYHLTKDGVNVGASINIPKDIVVESGSVETCTQDDVPVEGYRVGDKYIDLVLANSGGSHLYILVNDLVDVYTGSTYIDISNNVISLKYADLKTQLTTDLQDTFYTESEIDTTVSGIEDEIDALDSAKADKATTIAGYNISDAYTKTEIDSMLSAKKQVVSCPALTASGSQFTWTINNTVGADAIVSIYESGEEVKADITVASSTITIKMNQTADLQSITAGQFKAVILG